MNDTAPGSGRAQRRMLFVSTRFPFPVDSGGKIRTVQILRGLKGGAYTVTLLSPAPADARQRWAREIDDVCDELVHWPEPERTAFDHYARLRHVLSSLPIPVATDRSAAGSDVVRATLARGADIVVIDFPHAAVLAPREGRTPRVVFTHNVEAEIFARHAQHASNPALRLLWRSQHRKMVEFERRVLREADGLVAVSERDADIMRRDYGVRDVGTIRTGVDLDYFTYGREAASPEIVFTGSMDWLPNADGLQYFLEAVWPLVRAQRPDARMTVVGRAPPPALVEAATRRDVGWTFTGRVDDVRPFVRRASAFVIPLRIGGGTRLKVFEAMGMGCPVVSTALGVEGLPVRDGEHYLDRDLGPAMAEALVELLRDAALQQRLSLAARGFVEQNFSFRAAARDFEGICDEVLARSAA